MGEAYFISDGTPVQFRAFITALIETRGLAAPEKIVARAVVRPIATIGDILSRVSNGMIVPRITMQAFATSAVEVSLDISKARREFEWPPDLNRRGIGGTAWRSGIITSKISHIARQCSDHSRSYQSWCLRGDLGSAKHTCSPATAPGSAVIIFGRLLDGSMAGLLHSFWQGDATIGCLGQIA